MRGTDGLCEAGMPSASSLRAAGCVLRAQGQMLQDHIAQALPPEALPAEVLPEENELFGSGHGGLRNARNL
jgi:hypothetical protein